MIDVNLRLQKIAPSRYRACVDLEMDALSGYDDDVLGAASEGESAGDAIAAATGRLLAIVNALPDLAAALAPVAGPQLASILVAAHSIDTPAIVRKFDPATRKLITKQAAALKGAVAKVERRASGKAALKIAKGAAKKFEADVKREVRQALAKERKKLEKQIAAELGLEGLTVKDAKKVAKKKAKEYVDEIADEALIEGAGAVGAFFGGPVGKQLAQEAMERWGKKYIKKYAKKLGKKAKKAAKKVYKKLKFW